MPKTLSEVDEIQIIAGVFSSRENADEAVAALEELGIPEEDIQVVLQLSQKQADDAYLNAMVGRGFAESQALFYDKAIRQGKMLVAVHNVTDPAPIVDIFDKYKAEYNPDGSRNVRQDVAGMTTGTAVGAILGGAAGAVVGGPVGAAGGAVAGAVLGGGAGAAAGKAVEHRK